MKMIRSTLAAFAVSACICSAVQAAELLEVKPVVSGAAVSVEITADIPMTFTYHKIPGEARAVVDIADVDPEKIEPLIIVNKGIVSSISVDNTQISGMTASRVIFNLITQADIAVSASPDRKKLTATFGGSAATTAPIEQKQPVVENKPAQQPQPVIHEAKNEDHPGLDKPTATPGSAAAPPTLEVPTTATLPVLAVPTRSKKLEPVVPATAGSAAITIKKVVTGSSYIDIQTNGAVGDYKIMTLTRPERIAIDIPGAKCSLMAKSVPIKKFGITRARIGIYPAYVRVVLDASIAAFPNHTITNRPNALRINFN